MPAFSKIPSGKWRAQINLRGVRESRTFLTKEQAEAWANNREAVITGKVGAAPIEMTSREFLDIYRRSKERARERGIPYLITREEVEKLFLASGGRCAVTGISFNRFRPVNSSKRPWYPSLDRINSAEPYTARNCRFVCVAVNIAMGEWGEWVLDAMARAIAYAEAVELPADQAPPYKFLPVDNPSNYRQIVRRRVRQKSRGITIQSRTDPA